MLKMELVKVCVVSDPGQEPYSACSFPLLLWDLMAVSAAPFMIGKKLYNFPGCSGEQSSILVSWVTARMCLVCALGMPPCEMPSAPSDQMMICSLLDALMCP